MHKLENINFLFSTNAAVAVIQSIPIFDKAQLFSINLTQFIGMSVRFSHFLYVYLVIMVIGESINIHFLISCIEPMHYVL